KGWIIFISNPRCGGPSARSPRARFWPAGAILPAAPDIPPRNAGSLPRRGISSAPWLMPKSGPTSVTSIAGLRGAGRPRCARTSLVARAAAAISLWVLAIPGTALALDKNLVGAWTIVSVTYGEGADKTEPYGANVKGTQIYDASGHFAVVVTRADLPKVASN